MASHARIIKGVAALALVAALSALGFSRWRERPRFAYNATPLSDADYATLASKPGWHAGRLTVAPGIDLAGLVRDPAAPEGPWILFFSGNSVHLLAESQQWLEALCAQRGWGAMVWAYRGFDSSGGSAAPAPLDADGLMAYQNLLSKKHLHPADVHVVGFSMGTSIAAAVAARSSANPPASLTLLAPMVALYMGGRSQLRLDRYETTQWLGRIQSPTLIVHGSADITLKVEYGRRVAAALGARATLVELPGVGHQDLLTSTAAQKTVQQFIAAHSASGGPRR